MRIGCLSVILFCLCMIKYNDCIDYNGKDMETHAKIFKKGYNDNSFKESW